MFKFLAIFISLASPLLAKFENGDLIFTKTKGRQAIAVEAATKSAWTHTAVIFLQNDTPMVLEAVQPVQIISLASYLKRGGPEAKHSFKRMKNPELLSPDFLVNAANWIRPHIGRDYDGRFQWSDQALYCSELVWKIYKHGSNIELCEIKKVKDYNLIHPKVKRLIIERFGSISRLNLEEKVVAPSDLYQSELLVEFYPLKVKQ